jgi:transposase
MEAQQTLVELDALPVEPSEPPPEINPSSKLVFGQKLRKGKPVASPGDAGNPKLNPINRNQIMMKTIDLELMLEPSHLARAIWDVMGRVDLSEYQRAICSQQGEKGRPSNDPRMLASVWLYAYSQGISSAREIERQMEYEPGLMWLCGANPVNYHSLSDFRVDHKDALDGLFQGVLAVMDGEGLIDLSQVMHDGTKVRANAGVDTFRRKKTIVERLEKAKQLLEQMGDPREDNQQARTRKQAAQERAARERVEKTTAALEELERIGKDKTAAEAEQARVSVVEPEAHKMKHGDNAIVPSYNVQLSTESSNKIIVGMHLSQCSSDAQSLVAAVDEVEQNTGRCPDQMVVDGGFTSKANIIAMEERKIDLIGSLPDLDKKRAAGAVAAGIEPAFGVQFFILQEQTNTVMCPAGKTLNYQSQSKKRGNQYQVYRAAGSDCQCCEFQKQCCPREPEKGRGVAR